MNEESYPVWKALSDPTRRQLLDLLRRGPRTTGQLCEHFQLSRFGVMKHLSLLRDGGLVIVRKEGRERWNYLNAVPIQEIYQRWVSRYAGDWAERLVGLKDYVEAQNGDKGDMISQTGRSFSIAQEVKISAPREVVWKAFTRDIDKWWCKRMLGSNSTFHFDQAAGGKFVETFDDDEVLWGVISFVKKPEKLIVYGPLGMQGMAVASSYTYEFEATEEGTLVKLIHNAFGDFPEEMGPGHEGGWKELWESLRAYVEEGETWQELQKV